MLVAKKWDPESVSGRPALDQTARLADEQRLFCWLARVGRHQLSPPLVITARTAYDAPSGTLRHIRVPSPGRQPISLELVLAIEVDDTARDHAFGVGVAGVDRQRPTEIRTAARLSWMCPCSERMGWTSSITSLTAVEPTSASPDPGR